MNTGEEEKLSSKSVEELDSMYKDTAQILPASSLHLLSSVSEEIWESKTDQVRGLAAYTRYIDTIGPDLYLEFDTVHVYIFYTKPMNL